MLTLVTGGTGLLGNNVIRRLLEQGRPVRVLVRADSDPRPLAGLDVQRAEGDVRSAEAVRRACDGVETVIHAAGHVHIGWSGSDLHQSVNVQGTRHVAEAARAAGARMVHVSTVDVLGLGTLEAPADEDTLGNGCVPCPYVLSKRQAEQIVLEQVAQGLWAAIVSPCYLLGPWDWKPSSGRMLLAVARGAGLFAPTGGNSFCDARDVAAGALAAAVRGQTGRRYILGGENLTYRHAWRMFARITGGRPPAWPAGPIARLIGANWGDAWHRFTGREPDLNSAAVAMACLPHYFSSARAGAELGYQSRPAKEAAEAAWDWFRDHGYA